MGLRSVTVGFGSCKIVAAGDPPERPTGETHRPCRTERLHGTPALLEAAGVADLIRASTSAGDADASKPAADIDRAREAGRSS